MKHLFRFFSFALLFTCLQFLMQVRAANGIGYQPNMTATESYGGGCKLGEPAFQTGEYLKYKVYYNWTAVWMTAGNVTFKVNDAELGGQNVFHMVCKGKTASAFNWFFHVNDRYESYIDPYNIRPLKFIRDIKEGDYTLKNQLTFYHDNQQVLIDHQIRKGVVQAKNKWMSIPNCTQDLLSALYYMRTADQNSLGPGEEIQVDLILDNQIYPIALTYIGKSKIKTDVGTFRCVKYTPTLIKGDVFDDTESMTIYVTDDENRLPVYIESPLKVGWGKAYLTDFSGLKYPLTSKIK
ncbi:MAG: DUF3108 domain-containing protein [Sphingobacteriales bacterium]|jgi:hypothetical protein|nr:DUF3108 domain-containing protein [Sphingobacteriales bacterium]MBP9142541.1 DUF3108 domain-containing protein [Chitinophagales bacterium]MDA0198525.1 DUF3108 domain-containing protein [Bacteroidota bacterium]MBK7527893.1 DUF3108 domain-containing protein [Sphingobacteriales bacterium]MBK8678878.1 DUF3108 domain-containing protein [Sphingobacteriales bacterium]